jgi:hypothetical protein
MKYNHKPSIIGQGGKITGRMPRDTVKSIKVSRHGIRTETRKGNILVWFIARPFGFITSK